MPLIARNDTVTVATMAPSSPTRQPMPISRPSGCTVQHLNQQDFLFCGELAEFRWLGRSVILTTWPDAFDFRTGPLAWFAQGFGEALAKGLALSNADTAQNHRTDRQQHAARTARSRRTSTLAGGHRPYALGQQQLRRQQRSLCFAMDQANRPAQQLHLRQGTLV